MNIGERIKQRRLELGLTVEDVAHRLGKNRATIYRYENNDIENLPTSVLASLSEILETTPAYLMGFKEAISFHMDMSNAKIHYDNQKKLLKLFDLLNFVGKEEAVKRVEELTLIPKYAENQEPIIKEIPETLKTISCDTDNVIIHDDST